MAFLFILEHLCTGSDMLHFRMVSEFAVKKKKSRGQKKNVLQPHCFVRKYGFSKEKLIKKQRNCVNVCVFLCYLLTTVCRCVPAPL